MPYIRVDTPYVQSNRQAHSYMRPVTCRYSCKCYREAASHPRIASHFKGCMASPRSFSSRRQGLRPLECQRQPLNALWARVGYSPEGARPYRHRPKYPLRFDGALPAASPRRFDPFWFDLTPLGLPSNSLPQKPALTRHGQPQGKPSVCAIPDQKQSRHRYKTQTQTGAGLIASLLVLSPLPLPLPLPCLSATVLRCAVASQSFDTSHLNLPIELPRETPQYRRCDNYQQEPHLRYSTIRYDTTRHAPRFDPTRYRTVQYKRFSRFDTSH